MVNLNILVVDEIGNVKSVDVGHWKIWERETLDVLFQAEELGPFLCGGEKKRGDEI
jgi:hypothetical protein